VAAQQQLPSPFGHDPTAPPWSVIEAEDPEPVRDLEDVVGVRRRFHNTSMPDAPGLVLTVTETLPEPGPGPREAAYARLLRLLSTLKLYYRLFSLSGDVLPAGIDFVERDLGIDRPGDEIVRPSFDGVLDVEQDVERFTILTLELEDDPPRDGDRAQAVGFTIDPAIGLNQLHGYVAKCTKSAWASVRATAGSVRLRMTKNGKTVGVVTDKAGGGPSGTVGASTPTKATFDVCVRGLEAGSFYTISGAWIRGKGGGCP
jgi:hypothetical protein